MASKRLTTSPRLNYLLLKMGILDYPDVLSHYPRRYESYEYTSPKALYHLVDKQRIVIYGKLISTPKSLRFSRLSNVSFFFEDEQGGNYKVVAWNRPYLTKILNLKDSYTLSASYDAKRHELNLLNIKKGLIPVGERIVPVYSLPSEYPNHSYLQLVEKSLEQCRGNIPDLVPIRFREKYKLESRYGALCKVHRPQDMEDVRLGSRVLKYEEALLFSLKNQIIRRENKALHSSGKGYFNMNEVEAFIAKLPYPLTNSQRQAIQEIVTDMEDGSLMYRLLQGDVGSGKTLVAAICCYANFLRGSQSALMAPTDTLAKQHYESLSSLFSGWKVNIVLLTGKMDPQIKRGVLSDIADGSADIVIGTHALFSKGVHYNHLGLAIIDEQHKFGVNQRSLLAQKGDDADVLLMSATPIPRTLSMTIYGDLDVSTLTEFPSGEKKIKTKILTSEDKAVDERIQHCLKEGKNAYLVAPKIEAGEDELSSVKAVFELYKERYPGKCAILHGKMDEEEKEAAILSFKTGLCPIMVSTSLIEVGIDVAKADTMIIYEPQSFALSSLHQLRGRIGRDGSEALCYLCYDGNDPDDLDKLRVLEESLDGFHIAEEDLARRGPGEVAGVRQSGLPEFQLVNLVRDFKMFECARDDAAYLLSHPEEEGFSALLEAAKKQMANVSLA